MLLRSDGDAVVCIGQAAHAWVSGQLAAAWARDAVSEELRLAAEQHDVGMAEWDLRPARNPATGLPFGFTEMPRAVHVGLWTRAPELLMTQSLHAALLVSLHGTGLYEHVDLARQAPEDLELIHAYREQQRALQERLVAQLGLDPAEVDRERRLVALWDALSLALCLRWEPYEQGGLRLERVRDELFELDPWPLRGEEVVVRCEGRRLEGRYDDEAALHAALDAAPHVPLRFTLRAPGGGS